MSGSTPLSDARRRELQTIESELVEHAFPPQLVVETTSCCNFRCAHCGHAGMRRARRRMAHDLWVKIVDEVAETAPATEVWPTFYGEAFLLGPTLIDWLRYASGRGLEHLVLNSNGSLLQRWPEMIDGILTSGLKRLLFSLDGFSAEVFESIRVGGKRDPIFAAVQRLLRRKEELGLTYPAIICQFSVMSENEHEVGPFFQYWTERGAQVKIRQKLTWAGTVDAPNLDTETGFRIACPWANNTAAIHQNGDMVTCAVDYEGRYVAGNVREQRIADVWRTALRRDVREPHRGHQWDRIPELCKGCVDWQTAGARYFAADPDQARLAGARPFWFTSHPEPARGRRT